MFLNTTDLYEAPLSPLPISVVAEFPAYSFLESLCVRPSGEVLITDQINKILYQVNPNSSSPTPYAIHTFDFPCTGIVEAERDIYYLSVGEPEKAGTWSVYSVDLTNFTPSGSKPTIEKVLDIPDALWLNGLCLLSLRDRTLLAADCSQGALYLIDLKTDVASIWLSNSTMARCPEDSPSDLGRAIAGGPLLVPGINGVQVHSHHVYFSNSDKNLFARVSIAESSAASYELLADRQPADDFAFDEEGSVYVATNPYNGVIRLDRDGTRTQIAGGQIAEGEAETEENTMVAGPTAVAFGRGEGDKTSLYVTCTGGIVNLLGSTIRSAKLLKIEVGRKADPGQYPSTSRSKNA